MYQSLIGMEHKRKRKDKKNERNQVSIPYRYGTHDPYYIENKYGLYQSLIGMEHNNILL